MTTQRLAVALTGLNLVLLLIILSSQTRPLAADPGVVPLLRAHALQIVDDRGRVRASLAVLPADPAVKMPDRTTGYPETVLLRLITSAGRANVKIAATERGAVQAFGGESDPTYVQILAEGGSTSLKLTNKDGRQQLIKP